MDSDELLDHWPSVFFFFFFFFFGGGGGVVVFFLPYDGFKVSTFRP